MNGDLAARHARAADDLCAFPECRKPRDSRDHHGSGWIGLHDFQIAEPIVDWRARALAAEELLNTPEIADFARAVQLEAAHQRARWGSDHDAGKTDADWFWLIGYLGGKALRADDGIEKQLHRIITVAAAACNWHAAKLGQTNMRPGIETPASEDGQHGEPLDAVRSESSPSGGEPGAGAEPGASRPAAAPADQPAAPVPGELRTAPIDRSWDALSDVEKNEARAREAVAPDGLCDIDDLPDCLIGGIHQAHCRHAGKPVTKGGNP